MRLTTFSDYSLRVLMYVGLQDDRLATIAEMAKAYGISANHLMKVVHFLAQQGYLETVRGKGGGMRLARDPAEINLGELVRRTEVNDALVECFSPQASHCRLAPACRLKGILHQAQEAFYATLGGYTLADLLISPVDLSRALTLTAAPRPSVPNGERAP
jgi:Rrf2 family nitric oxide-sensitive transcriptional repressor